MAALAKPGARSDWLLLPTPSDNVRETFAAVAAQLGVSTAVINAWPHQLGQIDPFTTAQIYFYYLPRITRRSYPGLPAGLISLEYWFLYPLNYSPLVRIPLEALSRPIASTIGNTDYHQGDLEHVAVPLDQKMQCRATCGWRATPTRDTPTDGHPTRCSATVTIPPSMRRSAVMPATATAGSSAARATYRFINDYVMCTAHQDFGFTPRPRRWWPDPHDVGLLAGPLG